MEQPAAPAHPEPSFYKKRKMVFFTTQNTCFKGVYFLGFHQVYYLSVCDRDAIETSYKHKQTDS